jgi:hypothetical protein
MTRFVTMVLAALIIWSANMLAQDVTPFELGTFECQGRTFLGVVLGNTAIDFAAASAAIHNPPARVAPPGSGSARTPPVLLKPGDRMACTYEGVGTLTNPVVASENPSTR